MNCTPDHSDGSVALATGGAELLGRVGPLWAKLLAHHQQCGTHRTMCAIPGNWDARKAGLINKAQRGALRVDLATRGGNETVGYCIASVDGDVGEIESLYVEPAMRGQGVGTRLLSAALAWLEDQPITDQRIYVVAGNERALKFYERCGFAPSAYLLRPERAG